MTYTRALTTGLAALFAVAALGATAQAQTLTLTHPAGNANVYVNNVFTTVNPMPFAATYNDGISSLNFEAYCIELGIAANTSMLGYGVTTASTSTLGVKGNQAAWLYNTYADANIPNSDKALQIALWELLEDTGLDVTSGAFRVSSSASFASLSSLADSYLKAMSAANTTNAQATIYYSANNASQAVIGRNLPSTATAIPEPGTIAFVASGLLPLTGMMLRRRRK